MAEETSTGLRVIGFSLSEEARAKLRELQISQIRAGLGPSQSAIVRAAIAAYDPSWEEAETKA